MIPQTRFLSALLAVLFTSAVHAQAPHAPSPIFQPGEILEYSVKWRFLRLGTIVVRTDPDLSDSIGSRVRVSMIVESNPSLPFISLSERNEATMDIVCVRSLRYSALHIFSDGKDSVSHEFIEGERAVRTEVHDAVTGAKVSETRLPDVDWYVEGVSLFFYARHAARNGGVCTVPTVVKGALVSTLIEYSDETEELEIDAWEMPVRVRRYVGLADWTGASAAGVTGDFVGWLSDDSAAIPLRAELKIFLGSIDIELERWSRAGWQPSGGLTAAKQ